MRRRLAVRLPCKVVGESDFFEFKAADEFRLRLCFLVVGEMGMWDG